MWRAVHQGEFVQDDEGATAPMQLMREHTHAFSDFFARLLQLTQRRVSAHLWEQIVECHRDEDNLWAEIIKATRGLKDLLSVLIEGPKVELAL